MDCPKSIQGFKYRSVSHAPLMEFRGRLLIWFQFLRIFRMNYKASIIRWKFGEGKISILEMEMQKCNNERKCHNSMDHFSVLYHQMSSLNSPARDGGESASENLLGFFVDGWVPMGYWLSQACVYTDPAYRQLCTDASQLQPSFSVDPTFWFEISQTVQNKPRNLFLCELTR